MFQNSITGSLDTIKAVSYPEQGFAVLVIEQDGGIGGSLSIHVRSVEDAQRLVEAAIEVNIAVLTIANAAKPDKERSA